MDDNKDKLVDIFEKYIKDTPVKSIVTRKSIVLCRLTNQVNKAILDCGGLSKVFINTKVLKHLYDKKPAEEFYFLVKNSHILVKYPDKIYKNKEPKRGEWLFAKEIKNELYLCSLSNENGDFEVATAFRDRKRKYIKSYDLLWSWENDKSPS